ncbi:MAG: protein kinase [Acidobacteria bacterium]|nr:protein kinase [Acidobacteriota bacterium]
MNNPVINGRYRILQQIGVGGFGLTYLAEDLQLQTRPRVVVKHLRPMIADGEALELAGRLFQQEAEILYRLGGHPNIPSLIAHFKERGEFFLVQEFIEGHTLDRELAAGKKFNQKEIVQLLGQVLEILSFVHSQKVIHRDVKPANLIRRSSDGNIFLIDFGAVKQVSAVPRADGQTGSATVAIGSHGYMSREQMAGNPNFSSDLYALGLVAIEALTGTKPLDLARAAPTGEYAWAQKVQLSPELERYISKLVRQDFRQRFYSAVEALAALNQIAANIGFFNRQLLEPQMMVVPPIVNPPVPQPSPAAAPQFIPPTLIVPAQNPSALHAPPAPPLAPPKKSSGAKWIVGGIAAFLVFIGFLFIAGKILNLRWHRDDPADTDPNRISRVERSTNPPGTPYSLYAEALKQAQEAAELERRATTRFEWEQIANKYKRALALLATIDKSSPDYEPAQQKLDQFKQKSDLANQKLQQLAN